MERKIKIPTKEEKEIVRLKQENELLKQEDLNNKEAILELYMITMGGF